MQYPIKYCSERALHKNLHHVLASETSTDLVPCLARTNWRWGLGEVGRDAYLTSWVASPWGSNKTDKTWGKLQSLAKKKKTTQPIDFLVLPQVVIKSPVLLPYICVTETYCIYLFHCYFLLSCHKMCCVVDRLIASRANGKGSISRHDDGPQGDKRTRYSGPDLPEVQ